MSAPHDWPERPFYIFIGLAFLLLGAFAVVTWHDSPARVHQLTLAADLCPIPKPGQTLIVTVSADRSPGDPLEAHCRIVQRRAS